MREPGRKTRITGTTANADGSSVGDGLDGKRGNGASIGDARRLGFVGILHGPRRQTFRGRGVFGARHNRRSGGWLRGSTLSAIPATPTPATASFLVLGLRRFSDCVCGIFGGSRRSGVTRRFGSGEFLRSGGRGRVKRRRSEVTRRRSGFAGHNFGTEPDGGFLGFRFPIGPAKSLGSSNVPLCGFRVLARRFEVASELERDHGIARFFKQIGQLPGRVLASASPANAGRDLFPISHVLACIVAAEACYSQRRGRPGAKRFFLLADGFRIDASK